MRFLRQSFTTTVLCLGILGSTAGVLWELPGRSDPLPPIAQKKPSLVVPARANTTVQSNEAHIRGNAQLKKGDYQQALDSYTNALALYQKGGEGLQEANVLDRISHIYILLGRTEEAWDASVHALKIWQGAGISQGEAQAITSLGSIAASRGKPELSTVYLRRALQIYRKAGDIHGVASATNALGNSLQRSFKFREAYDAYLVAFRLCRKVRDRNGEAQALVGLGQVNLSLDRVTTASDSFSQALRIYRKQSDQVGEVAALVGFAKTEWRRGNLRSAVRYSEEAISLVEGLRADLVDSKLRASILASRREVYELAIKYRMELHRREPYAGDDVAAFETAERARSRGLLDALNGSAKASVQPLRLRETQRLLDARTVLLAYSLGEERSFLWEVTQDGLASFELPPRRDIEEEAREAYYAFSRSQRRELWASAVPSAKALSEILLPAAPALGKKRLVIISEGALQSLPFAALPDPASSEREPLILRHEIIVLPSASILAALREREAGRPTPPGLIAILGDPVFDKNDERVPQSMASRRGGGEVGLARSAADLSFRRLAASRWEAESVLRFAPGSRTLMALGFDARRELVTSGRLSGYRYLHFATHGVVDEQEPGRSGIVLSGIDSRGQKLDGVLRAEEIRNLDLPADLVVLSACSTAFGKDMGGDGRATLLRSFLEAGTSQVVASLWNVDDRATAELMARFYRGLLVQGLHPAAALRQAQISMMQEVQWAAPYYWAGFILEGDGK